MSVGEPVLSVPAGSSTVNADNPWPGLLAFRETDQGYFQGRQTETEDLFRLVMRERLTVLFGLSGLGKSSLLQAGLFPVLRRENVFPVYIRLDFSSERPDLAAQVNAAIAQEAVAHRIEAPPARDGETLWEHFHHEGNNFWNSRNRPVMPLLVFDQFEEIFTLGRLDPDRAEATEAFVAQLADLAECRPPAALKAWIDEHPDEAGVFTFGRHHYKILLSIREDFLPDLEALRARMSALALNRLRLLRMNGEAALLVVNQAQHLIDSDVAAQVVRFVAADRRSLPLTDLEVEPALLSVVCRELNNKRLNLGETKITTGLLEGSQEQVLSDFYERSTADLPAEVRFFIEDRLLTVSGYRDSVALENALSTPGVSRHSIDQLVERRLVRREDHGGAQRLELTHDLLAGVVRASRDSRRQKEEAERERLALLHAQEQQQEALLKAKEEERLALQKAQELETRERDQRDLRRFRIAAAGFLILSLAAVGAATWAYRAQREAEKLRADAEKLMNVLLSRQLAAQSQLILTEQVDLEPSVLLAVEALQRSPNLANELALRQSVARLPRQIAALPLPGLVKKCGARLLAVSTDGRTVAVVGNDDTTVRIFDATTWREISATRPGPNVRALAFSAGESWVTAAIDGNTVLLLEVPSGREIRRFSTQAPPDIVAMSHDGRYVVIINQPPNNQATGSIYDATAGQELAPIPGATNTKEKEVGDATNHVAVAAVSPDGRWVAVGMNDSKSQDYRARVFDRATRKENRSLKQARPIRSLAFSTDGRWLAVGSDEGTAQVFGIDTGTQAARLIHRKPVTAVAFSDDARWVATGSEDGAASVFDSSTGTEVLRLTHDCNGRASCAVLAVAFSHDGRWVVSGGEGESGRVFETAGANDLSRFAEEYPVTSMAFAADGQRLVTGSGDIAAALVRVFDAPSWREVAHINPSNPEVSAVAVSENGRSIGVGSGWDGGPWVYDVKQPEKPVRALGGPSLMESLAMSGDGRWVASVASYQAQVFEMAIGKQLPLPSTKAVHAIALSVDGRYVAIGAGDVFGGIASVFELPGGKASWQFTQGEPVLAVALSSDGRWLATASGAQGGTIRLVDMTMKKERWFRANASSTLLTFSPDGQTVAIASADDALRVFETASGKEVSRILPGRRVNAIRFAKQGRYLVAASVASSLYSTPDVIVTRYPLHQNELIQDACSRVTRELTDAEWSQYVGAEVPHRETCSKR